MIDEGNQIYNTIYANYPDDSKSPAGMEIVPTVRKNVMSAVRRLRPNPTARRCLKKHNVVVVGAVYHLDSGCRATIFSNFLVIKDDKTGGMNLKVRQQRKATNLSAQAAEALETLLKRTQASAKVSIEPKEWHTLRIQILGDVMKAFLDGEMVTSLQSSGFEHPTKTKFGFTVNGDSIQFDNLAVRQPD